MKEAPMDPGEGASKVRRNLARDAAGRTLFLPWYPFSRSAYVLASPLQRELLGRRMELYLVFWLGVLIGFGVAGLLGEIPPWSPFALAGLVAAHWVWWTGRYTRGLERTRYEPPSG